MFRSTLFALSLFASPALAQTCGGTWGAFLDGLVTEAASHGISDNTARQFLAGARQDGDVIAADRAAGRVPTGLYRLFPPLDFDQPDRKRRRAIPAPRRDL